ncbi:MAG: trehalose-6-phosphate synthase [Candidatus Obscuribacterales bacterium]|nr:trehalose-6-phosphate synthase [Candidatus Obscuribacterales bacterium]
MNILSYRGPQKDKTTGKVKAGGGVSAGLTMIWQKEDAGWYFFDGNNFCFLAPKADQAKVLGTFTQKEIDDHYNYCNRVLWPLKHTLPSKVEYLPCDRAAYEKLQRKVAALIIANEKTGDTVFVHDYQFCLLSRYLEEAGLVSLFFNHIPETKVVEDLYLDCQNEAHRGLLGAKVIGFHTTAYANDFLAYVGKYLPGYDVDADNRLIFTPGDPSPTKVIVAPLGIDTGKWARMGARKSYKLPEHLKGKKVFLTVARTDYTKGLPELLEAWRIFNEQSPDKARGSVLHMIGTVTRENIAAFKAELARITVAYEKVNEQFPGSVFWQKDPMPPEELAGLYANTDVLLIPAPVDGFNLTASEFIAAQKPGSGAVVCLSRGAGAFEVFGDLCTELVSADVNRMAIAIRSAANDIGSDYARQRMVLLKELVPTMRKWWKTFKTLAGDYVGLPSKAA